MLDAQDVINIKCKFVHEVITYFTKSKYYINTCADTSIEYLLNLMMIDIPNTCTDAQLQCILDEAAVNLSAPSGNIVTYTCDGQISLNLSSTRVVANYTASLSSPSNVNLTFPELKLTDNTLDFPVTVNSVIREDGLPKSTNTSTYTHIRFGTTVKIPKPITPSAAYISLITIKAVNGVNLFSIGVDTSPTSPYLNGPVHTISPSLLYFNAATPGNLWDTYIKVLENAAETFMGEANLILGTGYVLPDGSRELVTYIKNNPTKWLGFDKSSLLITYFDGVKFINVGDSTISSTLVSPAWTNATHNYSGKCGTVTTTISGSLNLDINQSLSKFNKIYAVDGGNTIYTTKPSFVLSGSTSCSSYTAIADVVTSGTISTTVWRDSSNNIVSNTKTLVTPTTGNYTFTVTLTNGCSASDTINLNSGLPT